MYLFLVLIDSCMFLFFSQRPRRHHSSRSAVWTSTEVPVPARRRYTCSVTKCRKVSLICGYRVANVRNIQDEWRGDSLCAFKLYQLWLKQGYTHFCDLMCELFFLIIIFRSYFYSHRKYPVVFNSLLKRVIFCFCLSHCNSLKEMKFFF